jgi:thiol-disulfide isomerase/thioredoxin
MRTLLALACLALASCGQDQPGNATGEAPTATAQPPRPAGLDRSRAGTPAPDTPFEDPDGEPATLADLRGKPVLLNLWATWCAPCMAEMPTLNALAKREGAALQVVTLSEDLESRAQPEAFLAEKKLDALEAWFDPESKLMTAVGVRDLPATILYDAQGREVWRFAGPEDWTGDKAKKLIAQAR